MAADWESTKELVGPEQPSDAILMTRDWDVEFVQSGGRVQ